jgi:hypothetical protein
VKRFVVLAATALVSALALAPAASAGTTPSPGCKGINNALSKGNSSKPAVEAVAAKLGCTETPPPPPADADACPSGTVSISKWQATKTGPGNGYPGVYDVSWTKISGSDGTNPLSVPTSGGDWFNTDVPVAGWVLTSFTGEIVSVTSSGSNLINQNSFTDRTGIEFVRFCGATATV